VNLPVIESQAIRYRLYKKALKTSTAGNAYLSFDYRNTVGGAVAAKTIEIDLSGVDGSYVELEGTAIVPAGVGFLRSVEISSVGLNFGSGGDAYLVDDVSVWVEGIAEDHLYGENRFGLTETTGIVLHDDPITDLVSGVGAIVDWDATAGMTNDTTGAVVLQAIQHDVSDAPPSPSIHQRAYIVPMYYTLIRSTECAGDKWHREYVSPEGTFLRTINAKWDNGTMLWTKDVNGEEASRIDEANTGGTTKNQVSGTNSWVDGAWVFSAHPATTDRDGRVRSYWGPEGFKMGPAVERIYEAQENANLGTGNEQLLPMGLTCDVDANTELGATFPSGTENAPRIRLRIEDAATTEGVNAYRRFNHSGLDSLCAVVECRVTMDDVGGNGVDLFMGWRQGVVNTLPGAGELHAGLQKASTDTNWQQSVGDGAVETNTDTGIPPVVDVWQTIRMEYHGLLTPVGVANANKPVVRYFIDGAFVAEDTGVNVPEDSDGSMKLSFGAMGDGTGPVGTTFQFSIGPIRYAYNEVLDPSVPSF
jgi:hypothetical protein